MRSYAESLPFKGSPETELEKVSKLSGVCKVQQKLYTRNLPIELLVNLFSSYLGAIASYLVIAVPIF